MNKNNQSSRWRTVRIFISSTFSDMHAERDYLVRFVFPELKEKCRKLHVHLIDVDLRWGVTEKEAQEGKALDICLDEIDSCRPYFLGLLGQRYGHVPSGHHHSITAQEIFHGVLHNELPKQVVDLRSIIEGRFEGRRLSNEQINTLVKCYQFDGQKYALKEDISQEEIDIIKSVFAQYSAYQRDRSFFFFRNESLTGQLAGDNTNAFFEDSPENQDKLKALKQEIIKEGFPHFEYDRIEKFGELVRDTLWSHIEKEIGETPEVEKDRLKEEDELHELFMVDRTRRFVGRRDLLDRMHAFCRGDSRIAQDRGSQSNIVVITGEPGCGKSALMARFTEEFMQNHPDVIVIPHFIGASPNSTSLRLMLKRLCMRLNRASGSNEEVPEDIKELSKVFPEFLKKAAGQDKIVFIIDAVNQLEKTDNAHSMYWLPQELPENVCFIISTLAGEAHDALMRRRVKPIEETIHGLNPSNIEELVLEYLKEIRKKFPNEDIKRAFFKKVKSGNPLYIRVALEELRIFPKFEEVSSRVKELPDNMPALFDQVLQRIENDFNQELVKDLMSYIACGRYGMTAEELQTLLRNHAPMIDPTSEPQKFPDMLWARLYRAFSAYLFERSGVIDFFHGQFKDAVGKRYLKERTERERFHKIIADYFGIRWAEPYVRALDELPHQQVKSNKMWNELDKTLTTFMFIQNKINVFGPQPMLDDYDASIKSESDFSKESKRSLDLIRGSIQLSSHVLVKDRTQLASQLWGRLLSFEETAIKSLLRQAKESQTSPWLRPYTQSLTPPGGPLIGTLEGHRSRVKCVAITPNGKLAVSGSEDETLKVWDIKSGTELHTLNGHSNSVNSVAITPDGRLAISASRDNTLKVWDIESGMEIRTLKGHSDSVSSVAITPNGKWAVSGSHDKTLKVWDLKNGREIRTLKDHHNSVYSVAISPDGSCAVSALRSELRVWHLESGRELQTLGYGDLDSAVNGIWELHAGEVRSVAITPDSKWAVSGSEDCTLKVWDIKSGREIHTLEGHSGIVSSVAITPDGRLAFSASHDKTLKVWDIESGMEIRTLKGHTDHVYFVAITSDGRRAVSASEDGTLLVWDIESESKIRSQKGHSGSVSSVAITPDSKWAVSGSEDCTLKVWDVKSGKKLHTLEGHSDSVILVAITPDGRLVISASHDKTLKVWDIESGTEICTLKGHKYSVYSIAITPDSRRAVSASHDNTLKVWDIENGTEIRTLKGHSDLVSPVAITPNGKWAVSGSYDKTLKVWDIKSGKEIRTLTGHSARVTSVTITPNGKWAVSGSEDCTLKVWDIENGTELCTLKGHSNSVNAVAITPDGRLAISASFDHTLKVWDLELGRELRTFNGEGLDISRDGKFALSGYNYYKKLMVWEIESGDLIVSFYGDIKMSCTMAPDGCNVVANNDDGSVYFLRLEGVSDPVKELQELSQLNIQLRQDTSREKSRPWWRRFLKR